MYSVLLAGKTEKREPGTGYPTFYLFQKTVSYLVGIYVLCKRMYYALLTVIVHLVGFSKAMSKVPWASRCSYKN